MVFLFFKSLQYFIMFLFIYDTLYHIPSVLFQGQFHYKKFSIIFNKKIKFSLIVSMFFKLLMSENDFKTQCRLRFLKVPYFLKTIPTLIIQ